MKKALVCGAGGFIGHHLVSRLKKEGYFVRGVDLKYPEFSQSEADEFFTLDLRSRENCLNALTINNFQDTGFDEVYQLAADMGGMGFIHAAECEIMSNSALINLHMIGEAARKGVARYFFSSSACVYRNMAVDEEMISEENAYPASPDNEYGWEKLYAERVAFAYGRRFDIKVRVARFQNCYGPEGTWRGGREKAPAALCRKVAEAREGGTVEVWGDGTAMRSYTYVSDMVDGVCKLMQSDLEGPVNIGSDEFISVNDLLKTIVNVAGKTIHIEHIEGPVGVSARNHAFDKIRSLDWEANCSILEGISQLYPWIEREVKAAQERGENTSPELVLELASSPRH